MDCGDRDDGFDEETDCADHEEVIEEQLMISKPEADKNLEVAGSLVDDPVDQISVTQYESLLLNDKVHLMIMEVIEESRIPFTLGKLSQHNYEL